MERHVSNAITWSSLLGASSVKVMNLDSQSLLPMPKWKAVCCRGHQHTSIDSVIDLSELPNLLVECEMFSMRNLFLKHEVLQLDDTSCYLFWLKKL